MAMVLDALSSYLLNMLTEMTKEEINTLFGASNAMDKMTVKLGDLKKFLADADRRNITDETVQEWVRELKGAMYDATDIIDLCQLKIEKRGKRLDAGCFNPLLFCLRNPLFAHDIGSRIRNLNQKLDDIKERSAAFKFIELGPEEDCRRNNPSMHSSTRETSGELNELALVGEKIEEDARNLVEMLTKEETIGEHSKIMVFAIIGVGGIGKTTLAQRIFNDDKIKHEFTKQVWLSVNQDFNQIELLRKAITEAGGDHQAPGNSKGALERELKKALIGHKTILVIDDVWDDKAWVDVLETPLANALAPGSRVLITTRHDLVARGMKAVEPYHRVDKLKPEDAWSLLKKQVVKDENDESQVDMLKDIGMGIVARCDGLPLAVKAMGGLLCQKKIRQRDWENILNDSIWSVSQMPEDLNNAIYLSYQDLPSPLKPCFMHFSLLIKNTIFLVDDIVGMWISEGFVHGGSRDLEELGREYYDELILRNLIEPHKSYVDQSVCSMHDVVRSFAQYVARDEALVAHSSKTDIISKLNSQKFIRRISVETKGSKSKQQEWMSLQTHIPLRTLISVGPIKIKPGDSLLTFSSLRTLHVQETNFDALAESLVQLKHLRYLSIEKTNTSMLPENIGNKMKFLQYISLLGCKSLMKLPGSIGKLRHLRYLNLSYSSINNVSKGFSGLTNMRKLYGFPAHMDGDWCCLEELGPLSNLTELSIKSLENIASSLFARKARLCEKVRLSFLRLGCTSRHGDDGKLAKQQQIEEVFDELCPPPCLEYLEINGYFGRQLPRWMMSIPVVSLGRLRILMMKDLPYCTELPDSLWQLPYLELLQIERASLIKSVGPEFLQPQNHEHSSAPENLGSPVELAVCECPSLTRIGNLPKTQKLISDGCPKLKVMESMLALQRLKLVYYNMETLPEYLQNINPKQLLEIKCDVSLLTSIAAGKSGLEWDKFRHIKQVKAYANDKKWYVVYTRDPFSFKTNISRSNIARARAQHKFLAYSRTCPIEEERAVGHACADKRRPFCQGFRCNAYRHLVFWLRRVCLHCCEAARIATKSDQWTEAAEYPACTHVLF